MLRWAVASKFKDYLQYSKFKVLTNTNLIAYIIKKMNVDAVSQRWASEPSKIDFEVVYKTGKSNAAADSLSGLTEP